MERRQSVLAPHHIADLARWNSAGSGDLGPADAIDSTVTLLLHRLFPYLQVGGATVSILHHLAYISPTATAAAAMRRHALSILILQLVKGHLVSNTSLSQLSKHYKLPDRLIAAPSEVWNLRAGEKVQANMFEAYIAALYLSYLSHDKALAGKSSSSTSVGLPSPPATPLTSSSSSPETLVSPNADAAGRAFALVGTWLNPLFTPLAHWVLDELRIEQKRLEEKHTGSNEDAEMDTRATGAMARLNEHLIRFHKKIPEYLAHRETSDQWTVMCNAEDKDGKVL